MKRIFPILLGLCIFPLPMHADEWIVETLLAGNVKVYCSNPGYWSFDVSTIRENDKDVIIVNLSTDSPGTPPAFCVEFLVPQLDVHHLWRPGEMDRCQLRPDWQAYYSSNLAFDMPLYAFINNNNANRLTVTSSEPLHKIDAQFGLMEEGCLLIGKLNYFNGPQAPVSSYQTKILLDSRQIFWGDAVREAAEWMTTEAGIQTVLSPEAAFDPLYSTWYNFHQNVSAEAIERMCQSVKVRHENNNT